MSFRPGLDQPRPNPGFPPVAVRVRIPQTAPVWTYVVLVINVAAFVGTGLLGRNEVLGLGAKVNEAIVAGQLWRLVTPIFLHADLLHIAFNSYALIAFGPQVERPYGRLRFLVIYLTSGVASIAFSFLLSPYPSVGASGAIFGLIGVVGAYFFRYRNRLAAGGARLTNLLSIVAYNLIYGFIVPAVDNWAHIGGLLAGLALGWLLAPRYELSYLDPLGPPQLVDRSSISQWVWSVFLVGVMIALVVAAGMVRWAR